MNLKEKIALNALKRRLDRGAITQAQALEEYKKITGQDPEEYFGPEQEAPETDDQDTGQKKRLPGQLKASELVKAYLELGSKSQPTEASQEQVAESQPEEVNPESSNPDRIDTVRVESKVKKK